MAVECGSSNLHGVFLFFLACLCIKAVSVFIKVCLLVTEGVKATKEVSSGAAEE